jgi:hypothetical protein
MFKKFLPTNYGAVKSPQDSRDLPYSGLIAGGEWEKMVEKLPPDFSLDFPEHYLLNQGNTSACVFHASSSLLSYITGRLLSPRYLTKFGFAISNLPWGAYIRDGVKAIKDYASCAYHLAPNDSTNTFSDAIYKTLSAKQEMIKEAKEISGLGYVRVDSELNNAYDFDLARMFLLNEMTPILFGYQWYSSWNGAKSGAKLISGSGEWFGHAGLMIGWDKEYYKVVDSYNRIIYLHKSVPTFDFYGIIDLDKSKIVVAPYVSNRQKEKEKRLAVSLKNEIYARFSSTDKARTTAFKNWFLLVDAYTYRGWNLVDLVNWIYAKDRRKKLPFDITKNKLII